MAEQIEPSPLRQAVAAGLFIVVSTAAALATELVLALAVKRWVLPAYLGPGSPQSPVPVHVGTADVCWCGFTHADPAGVDPGGQLVEQLDEQLAAEQLVDQLGDQTAAADAGGLEAIAE